MRLLITAGPTREPIDEVRFISNRSSGRMGVALAQAAASRGWNTTLLVGPIAIEIPAAAGLIVKPFVTTDDLAALLDDDLPDCDALIMAAAVCDYRPVNPEAGKLPRSHDRMTIAFEPTPDLMARVSASRRPGQRLIAFALEEAGHLESRAREKLQRKGADAIVANALEAMEAAESSALWIEADRPAVALPRQSKARLADAILDHVAALHPTGGDG